jgi:hypothetical protein
MLMDSVDYEATYRVHREFSGYAAGRMLTGREVGRMRNGGTLIAMRYLVRTQRPEKTRKGEAMSDGVA